MNTSLNTRDTNLTSIIIEGINASEIINSTVTTITTKTSTIKTSTSILFRLFNGTRTYPFLRQSVATTTTSSSSSLLNKYFILKSQFHRDLRYGELAILSLALPLYAIVFILFIRLTVSRISRNTAISGGGSRSRSQRRRQRLRSLIWTSNYLLVDFLNLLNELAYVVVHTTGQLRLKSFVGRFYCQLQVYVPLYLTVLMAYSLTAISIYRRRHFVNLNSQVARSNMRSILLMIALWILPILTSIIPTFLLAYFKILKVTQHETTNQCQISYTYESSVEAVYIFYRLGNIFLLPISISLACYIRIYVDLIRMQRRFNRVFRRHIHIRKNLISQILFLFLNFAVFWLPAEMIMFYTKNHPLKDAMQVTKSLNILLDPLIIFGFDTRYSSAARQFLLRWPFNQFLCLFNMNPGLNSSTSTSATMGNRLRRSRQPPSQPMATVTTWNIANNDDITILESVSNHSLHVPRIRRQQQQRLISPSNRRQPINRRPRSRPRRTHIVENHV
ncbi:unnamed protein product [Rotaria socialis]|uniref:G-protein coupled receptors family 1 profile domain-containing protein n=1 Tax=Rotaria socialis TaxID=392032 RepID=A0A817YTR5_9BILA|nr:unnamed protein product [Rotaria socialis]CAF3386169.1 unnamed protein product [Rotaria socialis]CAF4162830.1 unnamed protein product [Rotaria socialis]CAF4229921.1 unnamed protein product [Rotaria socialis]